MQTRVVVVACFSVVLFVLLTVTSRFAADKCEIPHQLGAEMPRLMQFAGHLNGSAPLRAVVVVILTVPVALVRRWKQLLLVSSTCSVLLTLAIFDVGLQCGNVQIGPIR
jgi:hypothetical protein